MKLTQDQALSIMNKATEENEKSNSSQRYCGYGFHRWIRSYEIRRHAIRMFNIETSYTEVRYVFAKLVKSGILNINSASGSYNKYSLVTYAGYKVVYDNDYFVKIN